MHEIVVHFGDFIRLVGPLVPYSSEGVEARHQPIKRTGRNHTNNRGFTASKTGKDNTDIMQTVRRDCLREAVRENHPAGKGSKKKSNKDGMDSLSRRIHELQHPVLLQLGLLEEEAE